MNDDTLSTHVSRALHLIDEAIAEASQRLAVQPDNPAIKRTGPTIFSMSMSEVVRTHRLDPFFHDWLAQYRFARELLVDRRFAALRDLLQGKRLDDSRQGPRSFAPEVIERVKAITGDLESILAAGGSKPAPRAAARRRP